MRRTFLAFLAVAVLAVAPSAFAQLELGIDGGLMDFGSDLVDDEGPRVSLRAGWYFNDWFGLEAQVARAEGDFDTQLDTFTINGVVGFRHDEVVQPYIMGGIGFAEVERQGLELNRFMIEESGQATVAAAGIKSFFGQAQNLGLRAEAGFVWEDTFESTTHVTWSLGFIYRLDF